MYNSAGIAFPTCISPNHCVGHYSPLVSEDTVEIKEGDIVKIDLGVHVDGYIAVVAHTLARPARREAALGERHSSGCTCLLGLARSALDGAPHSRGAAALLSC